MRRYYTREAYLDLVNSFREKIPKIAISSDFIAGFCGESEDQFQETISLIESVGYDMAYLFAYSLREKTHAHYKLIDDVDDETKKRRLNDMINSFRNILKLRNLDENNSYHLVLVEGNARKSSLRDKLVGRTDTNKLCIFSNIEIPNKIPDFLRLNNKKILNEYLSDMNLNLTKIYNNKDNNKDNYDINNRNIFRDLFEKILIKDEINKNERKFKSRSEINSCEEESIRNLFIGDINSEIKKINIGDYIIVKINKSTTNTLYATPICKVDSLQQFFELSKKEPYFKLEKNLDDFSIYNFCNFFDDKL
jgi:hypothetical protein